MSAEVGPSRLHVNHGLINDNGLSWGPGLSDSDSVSSGKSTSSKGSTDMPGPIDLTTTSSHSSPHPGVKAMITLGEHSDNWRKGLFEGEDSEEALAPAPRRRTRHDPPESLEAGSEASELGEESHSTFPVSSPAISVSSGSNRDSGTPGSRISESSTSVTDLNHVFGLKENGGLVPGDPTVDLEELEEFAKRFKQKRIQLGFTQHDVGAAMGGLSKNDFSQTTISRFEALNLSFKNMCKLKPLLERWLADTQNSIRNGTKVQKHSSAAADTPSPPEERSGGDKRRRKKRTSIEARLRVLLEQAFQENQRPNSDHLDALAQGLHMEREVIRVWFCNRRQKERRLQTIGCLDGDGQADSIHQFINGSAPGLLLYTHNSDFPAFSAIPSRVSLKVKEEDALSQTVKTVIVEDPGKSREEEEEQRSPTKPQDINSE